MTEPSWLTIAKKYLGTKEIPGPKHNPLILKWWKAIKVALNTDEVPWCAGFVGGVLEESGHRSSGSAAARSYGKWGVKLQGPAVGAIVVFWRGSPSSYMGHVGFVAGRDKWGHLIVLGGNQDNKVCYAPFVTGRVLGYYWPKDAELPAETGWNSLPYLTSNGKPSTNEA